MIMDDQEEKIDSLCTAQLCCKYSCPNFGCPVHCFHDLVFHLDFSFKRNCAVVPVCVDYMQPGFSLNNVIKNVRFSLVT